MVSGTTACVLVAGDPRHKVFKLFLPGYLALRPGSEADRSGCGGGFGVADLRRQRHADGLEDFPGDPGHRGGTSHHTTS